RDADHLSVYRYGRFPHGLSTGLSREFAGIRTVSSCGPGRWGDSRRAARRYSAHPLLNLRRKGGYTMFGSAVSGYRSVVRGVRGVLLLAVLGCSSSSPSGPSANTGPGLGPGVSLEGRRPFPADNPWNTDISSAPVDPSSDALIASCGIRNLLPDFGTTWNGAPNGIPYIVGDGSQPRVPVTFDYDDESDPGPYPIPADAPIEGGPSGTGDRHVIVIDRDNWVLYELFDAHPQNGGASWH